MLKKLFTSGEESYLAPEIVAIAISETSPLCVSDPGEVPGDITTGEWL